MSPIDQVADTLQADLSIARDHLVACALLWNTHVTRHPLLPSDQSAAHHDLHQACIAYNNATDALNHHQSTT